MKRLALVFAVLLAALSVRADRLVDVIEVTPVKGWIRAKLKSAGDAPTLRFVPADGRNAEALVSLIPSEENPIEDATSLVALHKEMTAATYGSAPPKFAPVRYETKDGIGVYSTFEDPDLVGKPAKKDDYKYATSVLAWLGHRYLVVGTVLADDPKAPEQDEGIAIVKSAAIVGDAPTAPNQRPAAFNVAGLDHRLAAPDGFVATGENPRHDPKYFYYRHPSGILLSGWLDHADNYPGFKNFWRGEKASLAKSRVVLVEKEFKKIGEWDAVFYTAALPGGRPERNLRACRIAGNTWIDVHLSVPRAGEDWAPLETALQAIAIEPKETM